MRLTRRDVLKLSATAALTAGLPLAWRGGVYASDAPETPKMRFGIIALTDNRPHTDELLTVTEGMLQAVQQPGA